MVTIRPSGSRPPLFCVHPAGGNVLSFVPLAQELDPEQPFYALQSRGLEGDEEPFDRIGEMAAHYLVQLREVELQGPYQLAGWSFGGLVAYEMACRLRDEGEEVTALVLFDTVAPAAAVESENEAMFDDDAFWLADLGHFLARMSGRGLPSPLLADADAMGDQAIEVLVALADEDLAVGESEPAQDAQAGLVEVAGDRGVRRAAGADERVGRHAQSSPIVVGGAMRSALEALSGDARVEELAGDAAGSQEPDLGWSGVSSVPVEVHTVPGDHVTLLARENLPVLAERLQSCLEKIRNQTAIGNSLKTRPPRLAALKSPRCKALRTSSSFFASARER